MQRVLQLTDFVVRRSNPARDGLEIVSGVGSQSLVVDRLRDAVAQIVLATFDLGDRASVVLVDDVPQAQERLVGSTELRALFDRRYPMQLNLGVHDDALVGHSASASQQVVLWVHELCSMRCRALLIPAAGIGIILRLPRHAATGSGGGCGWRLGRHGGDPFPHRGKH